MDNYSRDLQELMGKHKVNVLRTPKAVLAEQLKAWDVLTKRLSDEDPFFKRWSSRSAPGPSASRTTCSSTRPTTRGLRARVQDQAADA